MDIETADALETLRVDLRADIRRIETTLSAWIDAKIEASDTSLRAEMRQIRDETRLHAEVLFESLHDDIRMIAEGLASLGTRFDAHFSSGDRG